MKSRPKIQFKPCWSGPIEGYTINTIRRIYPKVMATHEFEDLLQEAHIKFLQCQKCYKGKVDNPAWFMSLYKRALTNQFNTLLERVRRYSFIDCQDPGQLTEGLDQTDPGAQVDIINVLKTLPKEFLDVLKDMSDISEISPQLLASVAGNDFRGKSARALRGYLCQQLGLE